MIFWHNDTLKDATRPVVALADRGLRYGDGVFDTLLVEDGRARDAGAHWARLARHAGVLGITVPVEERAWARAIAGLIHANGAEAGRWAVNTVVTRGTGPRGLMPPACEVERTALVSIAPVPPPPGPLRAVVARTTRRNEHSPLARIKSLNYADSIIALREAAKRGAGEAILLNTAGAVAGASAGSVVAEIGGARVTPPLSDGAMEGVSRAALLERGEIAERAITAQELAAAPRVWTLNTIRGLAPLAALDGRALKT